MHSLRNTARPRPGLAGALLLLIIAALTTSEPAQAGDIDATAVERRSAHELLDALDFDAAYEKLVALWRTQQNAMDDTARMDVLEKLAYVYIAWNDAANAQKCYETILSIQRDWLPQNFSSQNEMIRKPILAAYDARGYTPYTVDFRNIGVAWVRVADGRPSPADWTVLERSLPNFLLSYLSRELDARQCGDAGQPLRVIDRAARDEIVEEAKAVADSALVGPSFTKLQAVHGLLAVQAMLLDDRRVDVSVRVVRTESGQVIAPWTGSDKPDKLMDLVQKGMAAVVQKLCTGAVLRDDDGVAALGDLQVAVEALRKIDEAMELARDAADPIDIERAIRLVEEAQQVSPDSADLALQLEQLRSQLDDMNVARANLGRDVPDFDPYN
jgi:hypothetical protein